MYKNTNFLDIPREFNPFDFVEPCEPDCSPERHAYHQGQWDMATRIKKYYDDLYKSSVQV